MRADLDVAESGLERIIKGAFELLHLISFFTAGEGKEARAHAIPEGTTAWEAAGKIHTDIQRGFVRAEVVPWDVLVEAGGYAGARDRGALRLEGRDHDQVHALGSDALSSPRIANVPKKTARNARAASAFQVCVQSTP
jgi:ribosome-binding ATPase YchF (GTP1/OBG family)